MDCALLPIASGQKRSWFWPARLCTSAASGSIQSVCVPFSIIPLREQCTFNLAPPVSRLDCAISGLFLYRNSASSLVVHSYTASPFI
eukprot:426088-Pelagomonas_calceolata.AAC.7